MVSPFPILFDVFSFRLLMLFNFRFLSFVFIDCAIFHIKTWNFAQKQHLPEYYIDLIKTYNRDFRVRPPDDLFCKNDMLQFLHAVSRNPGVVAFTWRLRVAEPQKMRFVAASLLKPARRERHAYCMRRRERQLRRRA